VQVSLQDMALEQSRSPAHDMPAPGVHAPLALQVLVVSVLPEQVEPQAVPLGYVHAARLTPSQLPAHVAPASAALHAVRLPCGAPLIAEQVPTAPGVSHASHSPLHAVSQHTPSTQTPVPH
jgi:hypothetical protein